jgi:uncharacterized damage-inducible protein DinB
MNNLYFSNTNHYIMQNHFLKLFHFEFWANKKVLDQILAQNTPNEKALELFSHILFAQKTWLNRIGIAQEDIQKDYKLKKLGGILDNSYIELIAFIKRQQAFDISITYTDWSGITHHNTLSDILSHLCIHGAYHRGQIVQLLKQSTDESIVTDYIAYARLEL